ncbi:MAG: glycosyltransferase family 9 protein [Endomicrobium sp.]|jgi:ADP-heptose:LPS heptosyltransferase|nr:glycosyltransferase family 9 protein [Endomicrobium sp.]
MDKIVFFQMNQLGDLLFSLPVLQAAKKRLCAKIYSVVKPSFAPLLISSGLIDGYISKELPFISLIKALRREKFNKAVLFSESPFSLMSAFAAGIKERVGFKTASLNFLLTKKAERKGVPSIYNNFNLGQTLGLTDIKKDYSDIIKIPSENISNAEKWLRENDLRGVAAVSPGSSAKRRGKRLPPQKWAQIIDALFAENVKCVLSGASWEKDDLIEIADICKSSPKIFTAENGIFDSAAFYKKSRLFIGVDSGSAHLAAAVGTKCITVFISTDPSQTSPLPKEKHTVIQKLSADLITPQDFLPYIYEK